MIQKTLTILILFLTLTGCTDNLKNRATKQDESTLNAEPITFKNFLDEIPYKSLPLMIKCGFETSLYNLDFKEKYKQFIPDGFEVVGKLKTNNAFNLVLFANLGDILYPYLFTLDKDGHKIDSIYLHISTCSADPTMELSNWSVIETNLLIEMTDTAKFFNYDYRESEKEYLRTLDSTIVSKKTVQMDNSGRFTLTQEKRERIVSKNL